MSAIDDAEVDEFVKQLEPKLQQMMLGIVTPMQQKAQEQLAWIQFASAAIMAVGPEPDPDDDDESEHAAMLSKMADKMLEEFRKRFAK